MFSRIRVGDTTFHLLSAERSANSSDSKVYTTNWNKTGGGIIIASNSIFICLRLVFFHKPT